MNEKCFISGKLFCRESMLREKSFGVSLHSLEHTRIRCALIHEKNSYGFRARSNRRDHLVQTSCFYKWGDRPRGQDKIDVLGRLVWHHGHDPAGRVLG